ncbi:MAG: DUF11 domain-containing protein [Verrucomicrobia bacterium]|nr:DUF11 domain-containing protein [Verrucomicrobiota bacterium]
MITCRSDRVFHALAIVFLFFPIVSAWTQQHRATHLGNPSTRFADPIQTPEGLRERFSDPGLQRDMASILDQAAWTGNLDDLLDAAREGEIIEIVIQPGTIMPFMSSRKSGRPITLMEVLWAGSSPAPAYAFYFSSKGRRYRCVTPKACSNFFVEDLGAPSLALSCDAPDQVLAGRPALLCLALRNQGDGVELNPAVQISIPAAARLARIAKGGRVQADKVTWKLDGLAPGSEVKICAEFVRDEPGSLQALWTAAGSLAAPVSAACETRVAGIPAILLEVVDLSDPVEVGNEVTYLIKVRNQGSAPDSNIRIVATLADSQEFISATGATRAECEGRRVALGPLPTLAPQAEASWNVVVKALASDDARFRTELLSNQLDRPVVETESTRQY